MAGLAHTATARLAAGEPALHHARLSLPRPAVEALHRRLHAAATEAGAAEEAAAGALLDQLRDALELRSAGTILQLTLLPLLRAAGAACAEAVREAAWTAGMCPVCAAWPALAEARGLERPRVLRCGRCFSEWQLPWQLCPFCANDHHASLSYLFSEPLGESRRVFVCDRCGGYLKTLATLAPMPLVPAEDLSSLELDLAALDAGKTRPSQPGFDLHVELAWQS